MPTQLTAVQENEARIFIARRAGERLTSTNVGNIEVRRANESINLSAMSNKDFLDFLHCRDSLNRSLGIMPKEEYMEIPASARQYADNLAFDLIVEKEIINNKDDLDMVPNLTAQFVTNEIINSLKKSGFTARTSEGEQVTVGEIRAVLTNIFRDHNISDTVEETLETVKNKLSEAGLSFIKPENHLAPAPTPEPEPEPELAPDLELASELAPEPEVKMIVEPTPLSGTDPFITIPAGKKNNVILHSTIGASLSRTEFEPLNVRAMEIAKLLAESDIYMSSDVGILSSLPKDELIEESAANIISPLEEVEFNSTMNDNDPDQKMIAAKLLKAMKDQDIQPMIDKDSPHLSNFESQTNSVANKQIIKAEAPKPEVVRIAPKRY